MNPWTDLPQILIGKLSRTTGLSLTYLKNSKLIGLTFTGKTGLKSYKTSIFLFFNILEILRQKYQICAKNVKLFF